MIKKLPPLSTVRLLEVMNVMTSALFFIPIIVLFYKDEMGLSFKDFLIAESVFAVIVVILEVPSGWISDIWKRKYVLMLGCVFWAIGGVVFLIADSLGMAILSQAMFGVSVSLISGTDSALLYDSLLHEGKEDSFARLEGRRKGFGFYSLALASIAGGIFYEINHHLPAIMSVVTALVAVCATILMTEPPRHKAVVEKNPLHDIITTMRYALHGHILVGIVILCAAALFASTKIIMWIQQPYYVELDIPEMMFGIFLAIGYGLAGMASHLNHFVTRYLTHFQTLAAAFVFAIFICIGAGVTMSYIGIALLMVGGSFIYGATQPCLTAIINQNVDSTRRATVLSTGNLMRELLFIPLSLAVGWAADSYGVGAGLYTIAIWLVLAGGILVWWIRKKLV